GSTAGPLSGSPPPPPPSPPPPPPPPPPAPARLTLDGATIRDPTGAAITLRGINEGTWGEMQPQDAGIIAANGANVVRMLIRWWGLYGGSDVESRDDADPGHFLPDHVAALLQQVQRCIDAGLWVVVAIDSNCGQNGLQDAPTAAYCDPAGAFPAGHNFWTDLTQRALFQDAWVYLAGLLKDMPNIAMYELLPEPLGHHDASWAPEVSAFYQQLMAAIESDAGDTRTPFLVGARNGYDIRACDEAYIADPHWADRVVYTGDLFAHTDAGTPAQVLADLQSRFDALVAMRDARAVPVFVQQFGVRTGDDPDETILSGGLAMMDAAGVGYTGWQWRQNTTDPSQFAVVVADPVTGADVYKTAVLQAYSAGWKA
ncbi:MAG TPA: cellulase family glycosylhydrolase, partial [Burkholderiaceae bacterium]